MENKVEKIMKNYRKELDKIDKKYEVKHSEKPDTKDLENRIQYEKEFIAKLEFEGKELNAGMIEKAKERLELAMNEKTEIDSKYQEEVLKRDEKVLEKKQLKNSKVVLESGREVTMAEKDELDKADLKNKAIKELTSESKSISEAILAKKVELESKRKEWNEFKYEYETDENGKRKPEPTNADVVKKIHKEFDDIKKEMVELDKMQKQCDSYLNELKAPTKADKDFSKVWNDVAKNSDNVQQTQTQPKQTQPEQTQPEQTQPEQTQPEQTQPKQTQPEQTQPEQTQPEQTQPEQTQNIYSNSKDTVTSIYINAAEGKAYVKTLRQNEREIDIEEVIENRKELFKRVGVKETMEQMGIESKIKQFMLKRKINPVILNAIQGDKELTEQYIESVLDNKEFPFEYTHDLENSSLSSKDTNFMNRLALKESKIEGNEVKGAEKLRTIKNIFRGIKDKAQKRFKKSEEPKQLGEGKREKLSDKLNREMEEQNKKYDVAYNKLTDDQKSNLQNMKVSDLQKLGIDYTTACGVIDKYQPKKDAKGEKQTTKEEKSSGENEQIK